MLRALQELAVLVDHAQVDIGPAAKTGAATQAADQLVDVDNGARKHGTDVTGSRQPDKQITIFRHTQLLIEAAERIKYAAADGEGRVGGDFQHQAQEVGAAEWGRD